MHDKYYLYIDDNYQCSKERSFHFRSFNLILPSVSVHLFPLTVIRKCLSPSCPCYTNTEDVHTRKREVYLFESNMLVDHGKSDESIAELMSYYWARKKHHCKICESLQEVSRQFQERSPVTVAFSLNFMNTPIDPRINFAGSVYSIFAVVYSDGNHFIARIQIDHTVYEYDGMVRRGLLRAVSNPNPLTNRIKTLRGNDYNVQMVWCRIADF
jgi:hypothetical protein